MTSQRLLKESYTIKNKIEAYFTGKKIEITSDGQYLFCPCGNTLKIIKIADGTLFKEIKSNEDVIISFALSSDNKIVIAYQNGLLKQWDWQESYLERTWKSIHIGPIALMKFDVSNTYLATAGSDSTIKIWDVVRHYCTHNLKGAKGVFSEIVFSPKSNQNNIHIYGAADDYYIHIWDLVSNHKIEKLEGHISTITCIQFSLCEKYFLSGSRDKIVIVWDASSYTKIRSIPVFESIESLFLIPSNMTISCVSKEKISGNLFITAGERGLLRVFDFLTGAQVYEQEDSIITKTSNERDNLAVISQMLFNEKIKEIVVVTVENNILFYKLKNFSLSKQLIGNADEILDLTLLGEKEDHLAVATNSPNIKIFHLSNFNCSILRGHQDIVLSLDIFKTDKNFLLSCSKDNSVRVWKFFPDQMKGICYYKGFGHSHSVTSIAAPFLSKNFFISVSEDTTLKLWKIPKDFQPNEIDSLSVKETRHVHEKTINSVAISPNDQLIVTGSQDKTAKLWSVDGLNLIGTFHGHRRGIWKVRFSPVDQIVVTSSADGTIKLWELKDFNCLKTFQGHDSSVLNVSFIDRGMQLISSSSDGNIKIWNLKKNECVKTIDAHNDKLWAFVMSNDEELLITGGSDSTIIIWENVTQKEKEETIEKNENLIRTQQLVENLIEKKDWERALRFSIKLNHPFRCLTILKEILNENNGIENVKSVLDKLRHDQLIALLDYSLTWNTNSKNCLPAQLVLTSIYNNFSSDMLIKLPEIKTKIEGLLPYTERHLNRLNRLQQQVTFVDFVWENIKLPQSEKEYISDSDSDNDSVSDT